MKKSALPAFLAISILAVSFTACDDFFSSGWGSPRDYRVSNINLTVNNLERWFERSIGNPPLATRINEAILLRLAELDAGHPDRLVFQRYGVRIAVSSSNMGVIILSNAIDILADLADIDTLTDEQIEEKLLDILGSIQGDFRNANGAAAAESIADMIYRDITVSPTGVPIFPEGSFVAEASPSDVAMAILVLTLAVVDDSYYADDITEWREFDLDALEIGLDLSPDGQIIIVGDPTPEAVVLAAYLNLIQSDVEGRFEDNFLTSSIRDAFFR